MRARIQGGFETKTAIYLAPFFTGEEHTNNTFTYWNTLSGKLLVLTKLTWAQIFLFHFVIIKFTYYGNKY